MRSKQNYKPNYFKSEQTRKDVLLLVNRKLEHIKVVKQIEGSLQNELIIFFLMFCFLNNDCLSSPDFVRLERDYLLSHEYCQVESLSTTNEQVGQNFKTYPIGKNTIAYSQEENGE